MWMDECINDLWEAGIVDDKLSLIHKINEKVQVKVKHHLDLLKVKL